MQPIIQYKKEFGEYTFPEGLKEKLQGLSIEEQLCFFRTTGSVTYCNTGWTSRREARGYMRVEDDNDVKGIIVDGGLVVAVTVENCCGEEVPCFIEEGVCTYYACDNNGAGYKEREDYTYFLAVSEKFEE